MTLVTRFADCMTVLHRHRIIGVDLVSALAGWLFHGPGGQGGWIDPRACDALEGAPGGLDLVRLVTRGVPVELVQEWLGLTGSDPDKPIDWSC